MMIQQEKKISKSLTEMYSEANACICPPAPFNFRFKRNKRARIVNTELLSGHMFWFAAAENTREQNIKLKLVINLWN